MAAATAALEPTLLTATTMLLGEEAEEEEEEEEEDDEVNEEEEVNEVGHFGFGPPLWTAARDGSNEDVRRLLQAGGDIEEIGGPDATSPLEEALDQGHATTAQFLIDEGADLLHINNAGQTALHYVASEGMVEPEP